MTLAAEPLKAPFPVMGGKARVADAVWNRLGDPRNFVEPFAYGAAVTLRRPGGPGPIETINDLNGYVANFWRAIQRDPEAVAAHADWPVNETDLHARHWWLVTSAEARHKIECVAKDPDAFDAKIAGWWAWGACCWIGTGWCETPEWHGRGNAAGKPRGMQGGANKRMFVVDDVARPQLADAFARGRGVNSNDNADTCERRREWLTQWLLRLADRMRPVRVCCGHWARICDSDSTMTRLGLTGVFLDPPYRQKLKCGKKNRAKHIYANDRTQDVDVLCDEVQAWCLKWGSNPQVRIALCGLEGEYPEIEKAGWDVLPWKSSGYGNRSQAGNENAARERVWFSPHCLPAQQPQQLSLI